MEDRLALTKERIVEGFKKIFILQRKLRQQMFFSFVENLVKNRIGKNQKGRLKRLIEDQKDLAGALINSIKRGVVEGYIQEKMANKILDVFVFKSILYFSRKKRYFQKYGVYVPFFMTISPTYACQLRCKDCYAASENKDIHLKYDVFSRIIEEAKRLWYMRFFVISGGEPLLYKSQGKTLLDIVEENQDCFFLMYTNGLLIDDFVIEKLAKLCNLTPAISVEGLEKSTDRRRGVGVFNKLTKIMEKLREAGVAFGISVTATSENFDEITSEEFFEFFFDKMKASYQWLFHYMPIGRGVCFELMLTPQQRVKLREKCWQQIRKRNIFIVDFWNHGTASNGCISAARATGYFYIQWDGHITPCVFIPYSPLNIYELYKEGKTLNEVLFHPFFVEIRKWQDEYGYKIERCGKGNWLMPCIIRDNYEYFRKLVDKYKPRPIDQAAKEALEDEEYYRKMVNFDKELGELTQEIWQKEYLEG